MPRCGEADSDVAPNVERDVLTAVRARALAWALKHVDDDTAEDVAQEVVIKVWERTQEDPAFLQGLGELDGFACTAARNALVDNVRSNRRREKREAAYETERKEREHIWMCPEDEVNYAQLAEAYQGALARTSARLRVAFQMIAEEAISYAAAAARLEVTPRAIESRVRRVREGLRGELAVYRAGGGDARDREAA